MQFEYDPEQLIAEVSKRPGIWNNEHPSYRAKNVKAQLWYEIVKELVSVTDIDMTKSEMRELELQLQKKWKSLRDCFQKYIVNPKKFKRPYVYSKHLQFLLKDRELPEPRRKSSIQVGSSESDEGEVAPRNVWIPKKKIRMKKVEHFSDDNDNDVTEDFTFEANASSETDARNVSSQGQFAFANVDAPVNSNSRDSEDSDRMFLMSLLPHLRSIPEEFRLNVKLELMQVLRVANDSTTKLRFPSSGLD